MTPVMVVMMVRSTRSTTLAADSSRPAWQRPVTLSLPPQEARAVDNSEGLRPKSPRWASSSVSAMPCPPWHTTQPMASTGWEALIWAMP
jgi:hypothetical protein